VFLQMPDELSSLLSTLIVDDDTDMRCLVRILIEHADQGLEVAGEAANGEDAIGLWRDVHPDVIVLDQQMPGLSGLEVAQIILGERPDQAIVLFTAYDDDLTVRGAVDSGVRAVVGKQDWSTLIDTIRSSVA
jgi:DNA-binding NarL/FixJ family response regulator